MLGDDTVVDVSSKGVSHGAAARRPAPPRPLANPFGLISLVLCGTWAIVGEFVARLYVACRDLNNKIKVTVADSVKFNNSGDPEQPPRELVFKENPAGAITMFRGLTVLY